MSRASWQCTTSTAAGGLIVVSVEISGATKRP